MAAPVMLRARRVLSGAVASRMAMLGVAGAVASVVTASMTTAPLTAGSADQAQTASPAPSQEELVRPAAAQGRQGGAPAPSARAAAPIDLTGQWVSLVADDWRWRMITPPKGDVLYLPVNEAGRRMAEQWDAAKDAAAGEACRAYGAGGIMHMPTRLRISWDGDTTLKLETDTGTQTRLFRFGASDPGTGEATWQGFSAAAWELPGGGGRGARQGGPRPGASLRVNTSRMRLGYYRRNGVPYGPNARMTEWFTVLAEPDGNQYLIVTKILEDPQYMAAPYVRSVQFKKESGTAGWSPTPCV
jgi:hypothetical protein